MAEITTKQGAVAKTESGDIALAANRIANGYISDLANTNAAVGVPMNEESKRCAVNMILYLCGELGPEQVRQLPHAQIVQALQFVTLNGLDVFSGQVFVDKRWDKVTKKFGIRATPMGNAYEIMTRRFGVDVKAVHPARVVHEGDEFTLPQFDGLNMTNVQFKPTLKGLDGKAIAVYYLIEKNDGTLDFAIATRDGVAKNLMAQILNATLKQEVNRAELMKHLEGKSLDDLLNDDYLAQWISPAYRSPASRETMIIAKMKKNALLHYTRDLGAKTPASEASRKSMAQADDADMVVGNVVSVDDGESTKPQTKKIEDFDVEEPATAAPTPKEEETKEAKTTVKPEPIEDKEPIEQEVIEGEETSVFGGDIFDLEDL